MPMSLMNCGSPHPFPMNRFCMSRTPLPTMTPKPSPRHIWCSISTSDSPLPHVRSRPPVRSLFRMPFS